ncbi:MAG: metallophosphoesterase [Sandaracinaceae bacterium]|nr:metallophosphoesterase [Sandaracinaceae bacterium]
MKLAWATDVHLDHLTPFGRARCAEALRASGCDAVVLTGDLSQAPLLCVHLEELARALARPVYFVLGNHDFYEGSIVEVRAAVRELCAREAWLHYLPDAGPIPLDDESVLVGVDGFGDGRLGRVIETPIVLNDHLLVRELAGLPRVHLAARLAELGDAEARALEALLARVGAARRVVVATHVPPFRESTWHDGAPSDDDWLPFFSCHSVGEVLRAHVEAWPSRSLTVLCGHTHGAGVAFMDERLVVHTGAAEYGEIAIAGVLDTSCATFL